MDTLSRVTGLTMAAAGKHPAGGAVTDVPTMVRAVAPYLLAHRTRQGGVFENEHSTDVESPAPPPPSARLHERSHLREAVLRYQSSAFSQ